MGVHIEALSVVHLARKLLQSSRMTCQVPVEWLARLRVRMVLRSTVGCKSKNVAVCTAPRKLMMSARAEWQTRV